MDMGKKHAIMIGIIAVLAILLIVFVAGWYKNRKTILDAEATATAARATAAAAAASYFTKKASEVADTVGGAVDSMGDMKRQIQTSMRSYMDDKDSADSGDMAETMRPY